MTEFNQRVSAIARRVIEQGETIRVTNRGRVVLRIVPEPPYEDSLAGLVDSGQAVAPSGPHRKRAGRAPVRLSRDLDALLDETRADAEL